MTRRLLYLGAFVLIPGAAVVAGIVAAWRYVFQDTDAHVSEGTMRRIRHEEELARSAREQEEMPRGRRTVIDSGPARPRRYAEPAR